MYVTDAPWNMYEFYVRKMTEDYHTDILGVLKEIYEAHEEL